ncbi:hypothetical protein [Mesorhizobium sp. KR9-304]|uniref:hypothetical protein n=1 Tax=Mesorhizobium sp. KR9-304 TaxID=3156614 RepID=UPI0032B3974C
MGSDLWERLRACGVESLSGQPVDFLRYRKIIAPVHSRLFRLRDTYAIAHAGTLVRTRGSGEGGGAGSVALTVARLGDEP